MRRILWLAIYPEVRDEPYSIAHAVAHDYVQPAVSALNRHDISYHMPHNVGRSFRAGVDHYGPEIVVIGRYRK